MTRILTIILSLIFSLWLVDTTTYAACGDAATLSPKAFIDSCSEGTLGVDPGATGTGEDGTLRLLQTVAQRVMQFGALFAIGAIVFSGIRYTTSAGDDEKVKSAKNTAVYAIIGLILLLTAFPFVDILVNFVYDLG